MTRMVLTWLGAASTNSDTHHAANTNGRTCANMDSPAIGSCETNETAHPANTNGGTCANVDSPAIGSCVTNVDVNLQVPSDY